MSEISVPAPAVLRSRRRGTQLRAGGRTSPSLSRRGKLLALAGTGAFISVVGYYVGLAIAVVPNRPLLTGAAARCWTPGATSWPVPGPTTMAATP